MPLGDNTEMTRVLVVDDFPLVRAALAAAIDRHPGIELVGTAADGDEALELARRLRPDVIVLDLLMPGMNGLIALTHLSAELPDIRVLLLTAHEEPGVMIDAISAGAAGFLTKRASGEELADAVAAIHRGEPVISPSLAGHLIRGLRGKGAERPGGPTSTMTRDELALLRLVADGRTDREISETLYISPRTVQSQLTKIRTKTGIQRRIELTRWAAERLVA
jgi:DNA-binding NarL/FixJ family response regulator